MSNNRNNNNRSSGKPVTATAALLDVYNSLKTSSTPAPKSPILKNKSILPVVIGDNLNSLDHIDNNNTNNKINNTKVTTTTKATNDNENNKESSNNTSLTAATNTINTNKTSTTGIAAGSKKNEKVLSSDDNNNLSNNFNLDFPLLKCCTIFSPKCSDRQQTSQSTNSSSNLSRISSPMAGCIQTAHFRGNVLK